MAPAVGQVSASPRIWWQHAPGGLRGNIYLIPTKRVAAREIGLETGIKLARIVEVGGERDVSGYERGETGALGEGGRTLPYLIRMFIEPLSKAGRRSQIVSFGGRGGGQMVRVFLAVEAKGRSKDDAARPFLCVETI